MKKIEKEIIDNSIDSPRLKKLKIFLDQWMEEYQKDSGEDTKSIDMIMLGFDNEYKHSLKFSLTSKNDPVYDIFNAFNKGLGNLKDDVAKDIFNGMCEYLVAVFVTYPKLYEIFMNIYNEKLKKYKK